MPAADGVQKPASDRASLIGGRRREANAVPEPDPGNQMGVVRRADDVVHVPEEPFRIRGGVQGEEACRLGGKAPERVGRLLVMRSS